MIQMKYYLKLISNSIYYILYRLKNKLLNLFFILVCFLISYVVLALCLNLLIHYIFSTNIILINSLNYVIFLFVLIFILFLFWFFLKIRINLKILFNFKTVLFLFIMLILLILIFFFNLTYIQFNTTFFIILYFNIYKFKLKFLLGLGLYFLYLLKSLKKKNYNRILYSIISKIIFFLIFILTNGKFLKNNFNCYLKEYFVEFSNFLINTITPCLSCAPSNTQIIIGVGVGVIVIGASYYGYKSYNNYQKDLITRMNKMHQAEMDRRLNLKTQEIINKKDKEFSEILQKKNNDIKFLKDNNKKVEAENLLLKNKLEKKNLDNLELQKKIDNLLQLNSKQTQKTFDLERECKTKLEEARIELLLVKNKLTLSLKEEQSLKVTILEYKDAEKLNSISFKKLNDNLKAVFDRKEHYKLEFVNVTNKFEILEKKCDIYSKKLKAYEMEKDSLVNISANNAYYYSQFLDSLNIETVKDSTVSILHGNEKIRRLKSIKVLNYFYKENILPDHDLSYYNFGLKILSGISLAILDLTLSRFGIFKFSDIEFGELRNKKREETILPILGKVRFSDMEGIEGIDDFEAKLGAKLGNIENTLETEIKNLDDQENALENK